MRYSFIRKEVINKHFPSRWHYHNEFELLHICKGHGKKFVANGVDTFCEGDIILVGGNVPHFLLSDSLYYEENDLYCKSEVLQFTYSVFPAQMVDMAEFQSIHKILEDSQLGIQFKDEHLLPKVYTELKKMETLIGIDMLISLYKTLHLLSNCKVKKLLSTGNIEKQKIGNSNNIPINRTYEYLINNFKQEITLEEIANYAGQNSSALCRNFKKNKGHTIFEVLTKIRIEFACKLLTNSDFSITDVAYNSGFQNISHFNHTFKTHTTLTPMEYRKSTI